MAASRNNADDLGLLKLLSSVFNSLLTRRTGQKHGATPVPSGVSERSIDDQIYYLHFEILARDTLSDGVWKHLTFRSREVSTIPLLLLGWTGTIVIVIC